MKYYIFLISLIVAFILVERKLENYGFGYGIFQPILPYYFNTDNDKYDGFNIEMEGFMNIIQRNDVIINDLNDTIKTKIIKRYSTYKDSLYVMVTTEKSEKIVRITLDESRPMGNKIEFKFLNSEKLVENTDFKWIDVTSNKLVLRLLFYFIQICIVVLTWFILKKQINI